MTFFNVKRRFCRAKFSGRFFNHPSITTQPFFVSNHTAKPRGALEPAGVLPAVEVVLSVVNVVSFTMTKPPLNHKPARQICTPVATALRLAYGICARFTARPETAASQPHTDFSRVKRVDRAESIATLDAKRPYSTLMFSRKERKGRKRKRQLHQCYCVDKLGPFNPHIRSESFASEVQSDSG